MMDSLLASHKSYSCAYIDDAPIFSESWQDHLIHVRAVLESVRAAGLTLKLAKCEFAKPQISFLGYKVGSGECLASSSKLEAIQRIQEPTNQKALKSFLGMANYYKATVPGFSEITSCLTDMLKKNRPLRFVFHDQQREAFNLIKLKLTTVVPLMNPDLSKPFILHCDASEHAIGSSLSQLDDNGVVRPIGFMSKKLSECESRWNVVEREAYAVLKSLMFFDVILFGAHIDVYVDHDSLKYVISNPQNNSKLCRWGPFCKDMIFQYFIAPDERMLLPIFGVVLRSMI
jgi:hypothetical protein